MASIREDMEGGIRSLLEDQAKLPGDCEVTIAQFDTEYELVADRAKLKRLKPYVLAPRGGTALLDAIGRSIVHVKEQLDAQSLDERPDRVIVAVVTDGMENSSVEWSRLQVMDSVKARSAEGWLFSFLGANQDAIQEGGAMGFDPDRSLSYDASPAGARGAMRSASRMMSASRMDARSSPSFTDEERSAAAGKKSV